LNMEKKLGGFLGPKTVVHHINGDRLDNRIANLMLTTIGYHNIIHKRGHPRQGNYPIKKIHT
jgi:hypothetical protein